MKLKNNKTTIIEIISGLFILLFVYTAVSKLNTQSQFITVLKKSPLLETFAPYISWGLPVLELIIAAALFIPRVRQKGLIASTVLMIVFTGYLIYMIYFTPSLPCSCGGVLAELTWKQHLVFNIGFTILGILGIFLNRSKIPKRPLNDSNGNISYSPI